MAGKLIPLKTGGWTLSYWNSQWGYSGIFTEYSSGEKRNGQWVDSIEYTAPLIKNITILRWRPKEQAKIVKRLPKGSEVTILKPNALWFYVSISEKENTFQGWLKKADLFTTLKITLPSPSKKYLFLALSSDSSLIEAFEIQNRISGKTLQIIPCYHQIYSPDHLFETGDFNKDGYEDFRMKPDEEAAGYYYFMYDPQTGLFVKSGLPE